MLILPDRNIPRSRILLPVKPQEWLQPSRRTSNYIIENQIRFRLTARLNDGHIVWRGWFDDRGDFDAFLYALVAGTLINEPSLWRLPNPAWHPDIAPFVVYDFVSQTFLTATSGSNQNFTTPTDWDRSSNQVEVIAGGGGGANGVNGAQGGGGGGAASYAVSINLDIASSTVCQYRLDVAAAIAANGGDCWFNSVAFPVSGQAVGAKGGSAANVRLGGTGGQSGSCYFTGSGSKAFSGGNGGTANSGNLAGAGGGGSAGPVGIGKNGGNAANGGVGGGGGGGSNGGSSTNGQNSTTSNGANGGDGTSGTGHGVGGAGIGGDGSVGGGGAGGAFAAPPNGSGGSGGSDTAFDVTHGCGGGAGGASTSGGAGNVAGTAGLYGGAGGGGPASTGPNGSGGAQGIIVVTYTPIVAGDYVIPSFIRMRNKYRVVGY